MLGLSHGHMAFMIQGQTPGLGIMWVINSSHNSLTGCPLQMTYVEILYISKSFSTTASFKSLWGTWETGEGIYHKSMLRHRSMQAKVRL